MFPDCNEIEIDSYLLTHDIDEQTINVEEDTESDDIYGQFGKED